MTAGTRGQSVTARLRPSITDAQRISTGITPPTLAQCNAVGRTCFTPQALYSAYNIGPDLHVFDQAFGLPPMCGEENVTCAPGMPTFTVFHPNGSPETKQQPGNETGQEDKTLWVLDRASRCLTFPNEEEVGWTFSGGAFSHVFAKPDHQSTNAVDPPTPVPGYPATTGSDPVTGLGTPNAANLIPDLVAAGHGH